MRISNPYSSRLATLIAAGWFFASPCCLLAANFYTIAEIGTNMTDGNPAGNPLSNIIQGPGVGFAAAEPHDGPSQTWYTDAPGGFPSDYVAVHDGPEYLWFDLGMDVELSEISYWGYSTGNANGVREFNVSFATDAEGAAAGLGDEEYGTSIAANPAFEALLDNVPRQTFTFESVTARYVRVEVISTHLSNGGNGPPAGGDRVGVGEIAFENAVVVPDPQISVPAEVAFELTSAVEVFDIAISNDGGAELTIDGTNFIGPNASAYSVLDAPVSIAPRSAGNIQIQIDPTGLDGPISATLQIMSNDPATPTAEVLIRAEVFGDAAQFYPIADVQVTTAANDLWPVANLIQGPGVGFDAAPPHDKILDGSAGNWVTAACGFPCDYIETTGLPVITFDLGINVPLCEISVWGYAATNSNGVSEFSLRFATEADGPAGFGTSIGFNPTFAGIDSGELPNEDNLSRFSFLLGQEITARYVEFTCVDNHFIAPGNGSGGEIPGGDRVGLGEVAFEITTCEAPSLFFDVNADGDNLVLTWESQSGQLFNVRSETDPSNGEPVTWPIYDGQADLEATPPLNTLTIPRPADPFRLFVIESFPAPPESILSDDFENGQGEWTTGSDGSAGTAWELGEPSTTGPPNANSPLNCFGTNIASDYAFDANIWLRSPTIDLTNAGGATLSYFQFRDLEEGFDFGTVSVLNAADNSVLAVMEDNIDGASGGWEQVRASIPSEGIGQIIKIEWRFQSDNLQNFAGWYLDDVGVTVP